MTDHTIEFRVLLDDGVIHTQQFERKPPKHLEIDGIQKLINDIANKHLIVKRTFFSRKIAQPVAAFYETVEGSYRFTNDQFGLLAPYYERLVFDSYTPKSIATKLNSKRKKK